MLKEQTGASISGSQKRSVPEAGLLVLTKRWLRTRILDSQGGARISESLIAEIAISLRLWERIFLLDLSTGGYWVDPHFFMSQSFFFSSGGFAFLPFLWLVNIFWFFREAFIVPAYTEQSQIKGCESRAQRKGSYQV